MPHAGEREPHLVRAGGDLAAEADRHAKRTTAILEECAGQINIRLVLRLAQKAFRLTPNPPTITSWIGLTRSLQ